VRIAKLQGEIKKPEARAADDRIVRGYASVFGVVDREGDRVVKGAFRETIDAFAKGDRELVALWQHADGLLPVGKIVALEEDDHGLRFELEATRSTIGDDLLASVDHGTVKGVSFGGDLVSARQAEDGARDLEKIDLHEISPCLAFRAANPAAGILKMDGYSAASIIEGIESIKHQVETLLRRLGDSTDYGSPIGEDLEAAIRAEGDALKAWINAQFKGARKNG
jgi:HK97 family phage prohead protease